MAYDFRLNRSLNPQGDCPEDILPAEIVAFCKAHDCAFYSLDIFVQDAWIRDNTRFRVGTNDFPSRGINVEYAKVRLWRSKVKLYDSKAARALCTELVQVQTRAQSAGLHKTARALQKAVQEIGWEVADLEQQQTVVSLGEPV